MSLRPVDYILIGVVVLFAAKGCWRGFFRESLGLVAIFAGALAVIIFAEALAAYAVERFVISDEIARIGAYALCFLMPYVSIKLIAHFARKATNAIYLGGVDRFAGVLFGALVGMVAAGGALAALKHFGYGQEHIVGSVVAEPLMELFARVMNIAAHIWRSELLKVAT